MPRHKHRYFSQRGISNESYTLQSPLGRVESCKDKVHIGATNTRRNVAFLPAQALPADRVEALIARGLDPLANSERRHPIQQDPTSMHLSCIRTSINRLPHLRADSDPSKQTPSSRSGQLCHRSHQRSWEFTSGALIIRIGFGGIL